MNKVIETFYNVFFYEVIVLLSFYCNSVTNNIFLLLFIDYGYTIFVKNSNKQSIDTET